MNTIVIYESQTGFTKQYAEWISDALKCECISSKKLSAEKIAAYDNVIFGGWIFGGMIMGLDKLRKYGITPSAVFAVGSSPTVEKNTEKLRTDNKLSDTPFFYMEGGLHYDKLGFLQRGILNIVRKNIAKQPEKSEQDLFMEKALGSSFDNSNISFTLPLVEFIWN